MKQLALITLGTLLVSGCATPPKAEPVRPAKTKRHAPTKESAWKPWSEERLIRMDWHDDLYFGDKVIPGIPDDVKLEPLVTVNGRAVQ